MPQLEIAHVLMPSVLSLAKVLTRSPNHVMEILAEFLGSKAKHMLSLLCTVARLLD